jgi:hypothetical protein
MGYAEGLGVGAHVGQQVWNNIDPIQRQAAIEQVQAQRQQNALGALNLQKQQIAYQDLLGARSAAQNAQGTPAQTTTTVQPGQTQPPALSDAFGVQTALGANPATGSSPQSDVQGLQANVDKYPQLANQLGATQRLQEMKAEAPPVDQNAPVDASGFPAPATETSPIVQAYKEGRVQSIMTPAMPPDRIKAQIDYYHSVGNMDAANALKQQVFAESKNIVDATGNMADGLKLMNSAFGTNYSYSKLPDIEFIKDGEGNVVSAINKNGVAMDVANKMQMSDAITKNSTPMNLGNKSSIVTGWLAKNSDMPLKDQISGLYTLASENNISTKLIEPIVTNLVKTEAEQDANARQLKSEQFQVQQQMRSQGFSMEQQARMMKNMQDIADKRMQGYMQSRMTPALDTKNGNAPILVTPEMNATEPGRYIPAGAGAKALSQTNLQEDIKGTIQNTRKSLAALDKDFTPAQAAQLNVAMRSNDPHSAVSAFYQSGIGSTLTPKQQEYVADLQQLTENAMAMRSVLGAGQGSDDLRSAIQATLPNATTPDRKTASMKLDKFEGTIDRLSRGIPKVQLNPMPGQGKQLDTATAQSFLQKAGGDKNKARQLAKEAGYHF